MYVAEQPWQEAPTLVERLRDCPGMAWLSGGAGRVHDRRWSYVGVHPSAWYRMARSALWRRDALDALHSEGSATALEWRHIPRWIGYLAYDLVDRIASPRPMRLRRHERLPLACFARYDALYAFDHEDHRLWLVADDEASAKKLLAASAGEPSVHPQRHRPTSLESSPAAEHRRAIELALESMARGDLYQVNLARFWQASYEGASLDLGLAMHHLSPVPLGFYLEAQDHAVIAQTMELFFRWQGPGGTLITRPIKGTLDARASSPLETLRQNPKEVAEHAMIIDLMRNDLGRIAQTGSVEVKRAFEVEAYRGLYHWVSDIACRSREDLKLSDLIEALFPPGSVTGTPKLRAIEHIERLESQARGIYTGALGYLDRGGGACFAVAIRTAIHHAGRLHYGAGGGIVEASEIDLEVEETELKAQVFLRALDALDQGDGLRSSCEPSADLARSLQDEGPC